VGIPDENTWVYSEALRTMAAERGFSNIRLLRAMDILGLTEHQTLTKESYLSLAGRSRSLLLERYGRSENEIRIMIDTDNDSLLTYRGFIRFLETDLK
jgi:pyoverdine/dityrosine biosynthesis protein Dit1